MKEYGTRLGRKHLLLATVNISLLLLSLLALLLPTRHVEVTTAQISSPSGFSISADILWNSSVEDITDLLPPNENVTGIIETKDYILLRTSKGVWKSTDGMKTWRKVLDITDTAPEGSDITWTVFKKIDNMIFVSFVAPAHYLHVSTDDGETWSANLVYYSVNELIKLPNGTLLASLWSENDGGIIMKSNDGINWQIAFNLTEIGHSLGWLSGMGRHRHAHHVHYDPYRGILIATGGEAYNETYGTAIERVYYSTDMGKTWHLGPYYSVTEIISTPKTIFLGVDNQPDVAFWNGTTEHAVMTRWLRSNDFDAYVFRCLYKNGVLYIACRSRHNFKSYGIIATADFKTYVILVKFEDQVGGIDLFDGYGNYFYAVHWNDKGEYRLYRIRAFTKSEIEALCKAISSDQPHYYYYDLKNAKVRIYGKNITNLLPNPSFEEGWTSTYFGARPDPWGIHGNVPAGNYSVTRSTDALFGNYSVKLEANFTAGGTYLYLYSPLIDVESNTTYVLSVYFKTNATVDWSEPYCPKVMIYEYNSTGGMVEQDFGLPISSAKLNVTTEEWQRHIELFEINPETVQIRVYIGITGTEGSYALWLDGVQLQRGDEATPFIIGEQMTVNPRVNINGRWFNYTGTLNEGEYVEFDFGDVVGVFNITVIAEGSGVANVTLVGTKIATYTNATFINMVNGIPIGVYYDTFEISQGNVSVLSSSAPSEYANITYASLVEHHLYIELDARSGLNSTTAVYTANYGKPVNITRTDTGAVLREVPSLSELENSTDCWYYDSARRILYIKVRHGSVVPIDVVFPGILFRCFDMYQKKPDYETLKILLINKTTGQVITELTGIYEYFFDGQLPEGDYLIVVKFMDTVLKAIEISYGITPVEINVTVPALQLPADYRGLVRNILCNKTIVDVEDLNPKFPYGRTKVLVSDTGHFRLFINYQGDLPTDVSVSGKSVANLRHYWSGTYLVIEGDLGSTGEITVTDLYKVNFEVYDRLGNPIPVQAYVYINGTKHVGATKSLIEALLYPEDWEVTFPVRINGFKFYGYFDGYNDTTRYITVNGTDTSYKVWYLVATNITLTYRETASISTFERIKKLFRLEQAEENTTLVVFEGYLKDYYGNPLPNRVVIINITAPTGIGIYSLQAVTDPSGYFVTDPVELYKGIEYNVTACFGGNDIYADTTTSTTLLLKVAKAPVVAGMPWYYWAVVIVVVATAVAIAVVVLSRGARALIPYRPRKYVRFKS